MPAFSLPHLVLLAAEADASATALRHRGESLSYGALADRANAIARILIDEGMQRGDRVAVYMHRSFDSYAAIIGVMLGGGAYVPLDSSAPPDRLAAVLDDCDIVHLITGPEHHADVDRVLAGLEVTKVRFVLGAEAGRYGAEVTCLPWAGVDAHLGAAPVGVPVIERDLSLIFYTSGSTGKPKGVAHSHRSMLANVDWAMNTYGVVPGDRVSNVTSHHFDLCWFEMFATPAGGATLVMVPDETVGFPASLADLVEQEQLTLWCSVPSVLVSLVQRGDLPTRDLASWRWVMFAGERFPTKHLRTLMTQVPHPRYTNMYGTTETHIAAYFHVPVLDSDDPLPIGRAVEHVNLGVVTPDDHLVEQGDTGELVIRGPSLMEGYWRLPDRNALALRPVTFAPQLTDVCYHTGDLVIERPDGNIEIVGRGDRRVKVRGNLVDLDEVEKVLLTHPAVLEGAVYAADEEDGMARIEGGARLRAGMEATTSDLRLHVAATLPVYAVPERIEVLDDFPRTGSGKVSRRDLRTVVDERKAARRADALAAMAGADPLTVIRTYVSDELAPEPFGDHPPADTDDLVGTGILDSMAVAALVTFIEERWGVAVANDDFVVDNFETFAAIGRLVDRLLDG